MKHVVDLIKTSQNIVLSTHTQPDGDGLGCQFSFYWALKKIGKRVRIVNPDRLPRKYLFLDENGILETPNTLRSSLEGVDLVLIFDTNDPELLLELWNSFKTHSKNICFVDHHSALKRHPLDPEKNIIDVNASSTGQIVFELIKALRVDFDSQIAMPLYTSIIFDTNYFKYVRNSPTPHLIAAELLKHQIDAQKVHRHLFGNHSPVKLKFLAHILTNIDYEFDGRLAIVRVQKKDLDRLGLEADETRDIIDMVMDIESIEAAALFREDAPSQFKISFRSKGMYSVSQLAQSLGGGGHEFASGTTMNGTYVEIKAKVLGAFEKIFGS
ncbi:MAG: DHH family phosphoesterase [Oligoflexia bacterium]|nr:DHH family phosphoesterase [Oligoflexia bacterium]